MPSYVPQRGVAYRTWVSLVSQSNQAIMDTNPTLAAGDVKVTKDGVGSVNITTLPVVTPAASTLVQVDLSATEMTADVVVVAFADVAGAEWCSVTLVIPTTTPVFFKNTAVAAWEFPMYDATDNVTPKTGLTVTAQRSIDGGAYANCTNAAAEVASGTYKIDLSAADLNGRVITLKFTATGAATTFEAIVTQGA